MSYELSFSDDFFFAEGEPYDNPPDLSETPVSVWNAIVSMRELHPKEWADLARDVFNEAPQYLLSEMVFDKIKETNTCANLDTPVRVYIDPAGDYFVEVF